VHPILANRTRTLLYTITWLPIAALLTQVLVRGGSIGYRDAALIVFPMCLVYAFICQSSWYLCNAMPLRHSHAARLLASHGTAAVVSAASWVALGWAWARLLATFYPDDTLNSLYAAQVLVLFVSGLPLFLLAVAFNYLLITFEESKRSESKALELQVLAREAELKALRAQVDPHFLFNSLNSINALVMTDPAAARRMCVLLADFLRSSLKVGSKERIPLAEEVRLAECYLDIERVRFGARLEVRREIDPTCELCLVPPLIMQPLIENAITHGVAPALDGGLVSLRAERNEAGVRIVIENPFDEDAQLKREPGMGLNNVKMRLANMYNGDARLDVNTNAGRFRVELHLPCRADAGSHN
jgi:two-component system, LytTR family, sensor histidine kinase AlgZ